MRFARLLAPGVVDRDRQWSLANSRAASAVLVVLLGAIAARGFGVGWAIWVGFAAGGVAFVVAVMNVPRGLVARSGSSSGSMRSIPDGERRRVAQLIHRGRAVPAEDLETADELARGTLRSVGLQLWTGPLIITSQLGSLPVRDGEDVFGLVLLVLGVGLMVAALVSNARYRRVLIDHPRPTPTGL
ncbi:hypothetical protein [Actinomycetospora soli]|uniref:hypothetical protein n=1 Tax=Actinomycetospora soli TaxID=2893887 RepID=UPI001E53081E|nr:hypothetical protein [Actinomycetospora soli]MCD2190965.1 hypothetical protein [Actinomycetospora soli]